MKQSSDKKAFSKRARLGLSAFALLAAFGLQAEPKPNVVLILTDDLGYGDVSCYGQTAYQTPAIDQLAKEGVLATDYYVSTPYCGPSRASILTGRFPLRHGMIRNPAPDVSPEADVVGLSPSEITLAEVYQSHGYKTSAIGKWHLGHQEKFYPTRQGFDSYYGILYSNDMVPVQIMENEKVAENPVDQRYLTQKYTRRAVDFINQSKDAPFFLYLSHPMPHKPLAASEDFYTPETPGDLYHDVVRELDWSVQQVVAALEENGILENTIVIFSSDNGPHFGGSTGGFKGKKATPWEGGLRVPFIVRYPQAFPQGKTLSTPIWSLDLFPTLLDLCGIPAPQDRIIDGENITALLQGKSNSHGPIFTFRSSSIATVRVGDWKLFVDKPNYLSRRDLNPDWVDPRGPNGTTIIAPTEQASPMLYPGVIPEEFANDHPLFNLKEDRTESVDRTRSYPEIVSRLWKTYEEFLNSMPSDN